MFFFFFFFPPAGCELTGVQSGRFGVIGHHVGAINRKYISANKAPWGKKGA